MKILRIAAAASVIGIIGFWGFGEYQYNQLEEEIFVNYYVKPLNGGVRGDLTSNNNVLDSIIHYFDLNENLRSLELIQNVIKSNKAETIFRYEIHNLYLLEKHDQIIEYADSQSSFVTDEIKEIIIYSLLLKKQKAKAKMLLQELPDIQRKKLIPLF
jgi:hypothetical protein